MEAATGQGAEQGGPRRWPSPPGSRAGGGAGAGAFRRPTRSP